MFQPIKSKSLYESDFHLWLEDTLTKLRTRQVSELDWENLIEELETLGRSEKRELESRLETLWENTIEEQQRQLQKLLSQSPSLKRYLDDVFDPSWQYALTKVRKTYPKIQFPDQWAFTRADAFSIEEFNDLHTDPLG
ncbi:MAG: DUF29 domain-containing protein [Cyanobacteria bacterium CRU_2_1]|nr:DUF29 domain-containing protein [Cyanobacteria bacterium CRU_2_1]